MDWFEQLGPIDYKPRPQGYLRIQDSDWVTAGTSCEQEIAILAEKILGTRSGQVGLCCMGADMGRVPRMTNMLENEKKTRGLGNS